MTKLSFVVWFLLLPCAGHTDQVDCFPRLQLPFIIVTHKAHTPKKRTILFLYNFVHWRTTHLSTGTAGEFRAKIICRINYRLGRIFRLTSISFDLARISRSSALHTHPEFTRRTKCHYHSTKRLKRLLECCILSIRWPSISD